MCTEWLWNGKNEENGTAVKHGQSAGRAAAEQRVLPRTAATPPHPAAAPRRRGTSAAGGLPRGTGQRSRRRQGAYGGWGLREGLAVRGGGDGALRGSPAPRGRAAGRGGPSPRARLGAAARPRRRLRTHRKSWSRPWLRLVNSTKPSMAAAAAGTVRGPRQLRPRPAPPRRRNPPLRCVFPAGPRRNAPLPRRPSTAGQVSSLKAPPGRGSPVPAGSGGSGSPPGPGPVLSHPSAAAPRLGRCAGWKRARQGRALPRPGGLWRGNGVDKVGETTCFPDCSPGFYRGRARLFNEEEADTFECFAIILRQTRAQAFALPLSVGRRRCLPG